MNKMALLLVIISALITVSNTFITFVYIDRYEDVCSEAKRSAVVLLSCPAE